MQSDKIDAAKSQRTEEQSQKIVFEQMPQVNTLRGASMSTSPQHVPFEDLVHAGIVGLIDALNKFDSEKNVKLPGMRSSAYQAPSSTACARWTGVRAICAGGRGRSTR